MRPGRCLFAVGLAALSLGAAPTGKPQLTLMELDAALGALSAGSMGQAAKPLLEKLGFSAKDVARLTAQSQIETATRTEKNLDADEDLESVLHVAVRVPAPGDDQKGGTWFHAIAWLDPDHDAVRVAGREAISFDDENGDALFELDFRAVHHADAEDGVVAWHAVGGSEACAHQTSGLHIVSFGRGRFERLVELDVTARQGGNECDPEPKKAASIELGIETPAVISVHTLSGEVIRKLKFDKASFRYR